MRDLRSSGSPPRGRRGQLITGRLQAHGKANYQFAPDGSPSYYLRLLTSQGPETLWGTDLERAMAHAQSKPRIGAMVGVQRIGSEMVALPRVRGSNHSGPTRTVQRTRWRVEEVSYLARTREQARRALNARLDDRRTLSARPELRSTFLSLHVARQYAERNIRDPRDRELFLTRIQAVMAASISKGVLIPAPRVRDDRPARVNFNTRKDDPTR